MGTGMDTGAWYKRLFAFKGMMAMRPAIKTLLILLLSAALMAAAIGCGGGEEQSQKGTLEKEITPVSSGASATGVEEAQLKVDWVNYSFPESYGDKIVIVGEVTNTGDKIAENINVSIKFYDKSALSDTDSGGLPIGSLLPGEKSSFSGGTDKAADRIEVSARGVTTEKQPYREFKEVSGVYTPPTGRYDTMGEYVGEVTNTGTMTATYVHAILTGYDAGGKIVVSDVTYPEPSRMAPGQTSPFKEYVSYNADKVAKLVIQFACSNTE